MKQWAIDALNYIQDNWMDQKKVARAYARYVNSKSAIMQEIATTVSLISSMDLDVESYYEEGITDGFPQEVTDTLTEYGNSIIVTTEGEIASIKDFFIQVAKNEDTEMGEREVLTVSGNSVTVDDVLGSIGDYVNNSAAMSTALETLGKSTEEVKNSTADYLSTLKAKLGTAYESISSNALNYWDIINSAGSSMKDKVSTMLSSVTSCVATIDDRLDDDTETFNVEINSDSYTGASVIGAWATASSNVFSFTWNVVKTTTKVIVGAVGGLLKLGARFVGKLWNKYVKPAYSANDFVINSDYDEDYFQYPLCQYRVTKSQLDAGYCYDTNDNQVQFASLIPSEFGQEFTDFSQLFVAIPVETGISIETSFGMICMSHVLNNNNESCLQLQIFLRPSTPIATPLTNSCLVYRWGEGHFLTARSLSDQFNLLFNEENTINTAIDTDKKAINSLLASRWRMQFFIGILSLAYSLDDSVWIKNVTDVDYPGLATGLWIRQFGIAFCIDDTISDGDCTQVSWLVASDRTVKKFEFTSEPSNLDFCKCITGYASLNQHGNLNIINSEDNEVISACGMLAMWVMGNSYAVMKSVYQSTGQFPVFVPYNARAGFGQFHYTLNTDAENFKTATNIATVIVTAATIAAVAIGIGVVSVKIAKALTRKASRVDALNWLYQDAVQNYGINSDEAKVAYDTWYKAKRKNVAATKIAGLFGIRPKFSSAESSNITDAKVNVGYGGEIISLIK